MASMNFSAGKQFVKPPQRGIFPLDHDAECKTKMKVRVVSWPPIPRKVGAVQLSRDWILLISKVGIIVSSPIQ